MVALLICFSAFSQESSPASSQPSKTDKRFFVGLSYSYMNISTKLTSLSLHSIWYDQDLGTQELSSDEIDMINSYAERNNRVNNLNVDIGMNIIGNQASKWRLEGNIMLGLAHFTSKVYNTTTSSEEYLFKSDFSKPALGIAFNAGYRFNSHWGITLRPLFATTFGKITKVEDKVNLVPENVTQAGEDKFYSFYERVSITADFSVGPVTISAGPGFYMANSRHAYTITRTNNLTGQINTEEIKTTTRSRNFMDGNLSVLWKINTLFTLSATTGIGNDIIFGAGLHYNF